MPPLQSNLPALNYLVYDQSYCDFLGELYRLLDPLLFALDTAIEMDITARSHGVFLDNYLADGYTIAYDDECCRGGCIARASKHVMRLADWWALVERAAGAAGIPLEIIKDHFSDFLIYDLTYDLGIIMITTTGFITFMSTALPFTGELLYPLREERSG